MGAETSSPERRPSRPLDGVRVIDFTHVLAGPACGYYLGLLGADVIKVESISKGDAMRHRGGTDTARQADAMSTAYLTQAAGKRSIAIDLGQPGGRDVFEALLASADVYVENHRPETMKALGLDENVVMARHPKLIYCAMSGYGRGGALESAAAYDVNIQAACGIMTMTGTPDMGPTRTGAPIMDYSTGLAAGFAVSAALFERQKTGAGTFIDVSMLETAFTLMSSTVTDFLATGNAPQQRGNKANSRSPGAGSYPCKDGVISLGVNEESQFVALARVLGRDAWIGDPRFADRTSRRAHAADLETEIAEILLGRSADEWERDMMAAGVPAARLRTLPEALEMQERHGRTYTHRDPATGVDVPTLPFRIGRAPIHAPARTPPRHGADTTEILGELGYTSAQIDALLNEQCVAAPAEAASED